MHNKKITISLWQKTLHPCGVFSARNFKAACFTPDVRSIPERKNFRPSIFYTSKNLFTQVNFLRIFKFKTIFGGFVKKYLLFRFIILYLLLKKLQICL